MTFAKASACSTAFTRAGRSYRKFALAVLPAGLVASLALGLLSGLATPACAYEDTNAFNSMLGFFGMQFDKEKEEAIDYRARPPLVVPPNRQALPQPVEKRQQDANWPIDPDVTARRRAAADSHRPAPQVNLNTRAELSPQELEKGKTDVKDEKQPGSRPEDDCQANSGTAACVYAPWKLLSNVFSKKEEEKEVVNVGEEPDRKYLTEPPVGYRAATRTTHVESDKDVKTADPGDAAAYTRNQQRHKSGLDD
ncbi:hypothetical protein [Beijerinckia mobilis]|uniref:hypothetical protein n=1 Tax=Beijerinckia mobilis TaxID=231434 RepID=UPI0005525ABC|nr:hypothetical protein [Beijerinckia mobilis]